MAQMTRGALRKLVGMDADRVEEAITEILNERDAQVEAAKKPLEEKIAKLEDDLKQAEAEVQSITDSYDNDQESFKAMYEAEKAAREDAEANLEKEKKAHAETVQGHTLKEETTAKSKALAELIAGAETSKGKIRPDQVDLALKVINADTVKWDKKDDTFSVKNADEVMESLVQHGGFDFAKAEAKSAIAGGFFKQNVAANPTENKNANQMMNNIIRGGVADDG